MFCGWGHVRWCKCVVCTEVLGYSRKSSYRRMKRREVRLDQREIDMSIRKPRPGEYNGPVEDPFNDAAFQGDYPTVHEYLFQTQWADGSFRHTSTISVFTDNGVMKLVLNDRDNNRSAFFTAKTWRDLFDKMEAALAGETVDWRFKGGSGVDKMKTPF